MSKINNNIIPELLEQITKLHLDLAVTKNHNKMLQQELKQYNEKEKTDNNMNNIDKTEDL